MSLMDSLRSWFNLTAWPETPVQTRSADGTLASFIARIEGARSQTWRTASTADALGVPAIFSAVALIANGTGSLSLKAFRSGQELPDTERPRLIVRPNPFTTPRDFFRDTAYSMAVYGEAWWWVAARDFDNLPLSLIPVNPREITVTEDPDDLRFPVIEWRGRKMRNDDMRQITYLREPGALRGFGPLQKCGAAVSVAVEAQEFAANYYADGGVPSIGIKLAYPISGDKDMTDEEAESEADKLRAQWMSKAHNTPRVYGPDIDKIEEFNQSAEGAQMLAAREYNNVDAARMFNIPAPMIEAAVAGSSLTYQNIPSLFDSFARRCLTPNYLEPIEQTLSDLLTRQTVARFNLEALLRVDIKTRFEVYGLGIDKGIYTPELAQAKEGIVAGDVEFAPVPLSVPQAVPASLPIQSRSAPTNGVFRCASCRKARFVVESTEPLKLQCVNCKAVSEPPSALQTRTETPAPMQMHLHLPERMAVIDNHQPEVRVEVHPPDVRIEGPQVNVAQPNVVVHTPAVTVSPPDVRIENHPPSITLLPAPVTVEQPPRLRTISRLGYDKQGRVSEIDEQAQPA